MKLYNFLHIIIIIIITIIIYLKLFNFLHIIFIINYLSLYNYLHMIIISICYLKLYCKKVKLVIVVEGDLKAPFSIATTSSCRGGRYSFPWIAPLYPWSIL